MYKSKLSALLVVSILFVGVIIGLIVASNLNWTYQSVAENRPRKKVVFNLPPPTPRKADFDLQTTAKAFTQVAKKVIPTVVSVHSTKIVASKDLWRRHFDDKDLRDFFGERFFRFPIPKEFRQRGEGSGIIISENGYILTNVHVIEKAEQIEVTLDDKRSFSAEIIGADSLTEVAVIKIESNGLPVAQLGNSDLAEIGEWVLAIGNPLELSSTVTAGIISAIGRDINIISDNYGVENFIQTDAAINPGNSGGALVNLTGEVIGVNTAIATETGYYQGYGFAIPINLAKEIMADLINEGRVIRGYLGISMQDVDEKKAKALNLRKPKGVFVDSVLDDGPALKAGIRPMDVLIKIDDYEVNRANQVQSVIARKNPGDKVQITLIRKNQKITLDVILGERESGDTETISSKKRKRNFRDLGIEVEELRNRVARKLGYEGLEGVIVTEIASFSPAEEAGLLVSDLITKIGEQKVTSVKDFRKALAALNEGDVVIFRVRRGKYTLHIFIEVPEK